jgi:FeS assembly SUF system regulator
MIRISKLTDYALAIMAFLSKDPERFMQTSDIALNTHIAKPTTAKLLKRLAKQGLLESHRGTTGGYKLIKAAEDISVADIIEVIEGPLAIMDCTLGQDHCAMYKNCAINAPWAQINRVIVKSLDTIKLSDLHPIASNHGGSQ